MREPAPDFSTSQYQRPNQPWVCGLAEHGHACPAGPTGRGHCPALAECAPLRDGDRWACNRSALRGGPCDEGPTPDGGCGCVQTCRPVRSLRAKRGRFIVACACLALGAVVISLSADWRNQIIKPGPLAQQHAQLLGQPGAEPNCGACHTAASQNVAGWATSLVIAHDDLPTQSQLCMNCHAKTIAKDHALAAHNLPAGVLEKITGTRGAARPAATTDVACATCHREHHGAQFNLTAMDNAACQSCHQQRFASFAADHPEFGNWPYERRTGIVFNHASHRGKHFAEKKQAFDCRTCHVSDSTNTVEQLTAYETACAKCHDEKIATSVGRGVPMLALPTLDVDALAKAGHNIGPWPKAATGDFDGRVPPMMKLLLAADPAAAEAMAKLGPSFEFQDVDPDDAQQLAACANLALATKTLLADVSKRGIAAVRERLTAALGRDVTDADVATLTAGLSIDTIRATATWVPGIVSANEPLPQTLGGMLSTQSGVSMFSPLSNMPTPAAADDMPPQRSVTLGPAGSWTRDDATLSLRYTPASHADPVLASWLEVLARTPQLESRPVPAAMFKELSKTTAPGLCASCHSTEQSERGEFVINWQAHDRANESRGFTKFTHGPHLTMPQLADCTSCHAIDDAANTTVAYTDSDPHRFVSEFKPMSKQSCAECHTKSLAGDSCQSCHNYHVEAVEGWRLSAPSNDKRQQAVQTALPLFLEALKVEGGNAPAR
jgi:predicted CXXCH cytochrome family protein